MSRAISFHFSIPDTVAHVTVSRLAEEMLSAIRESNRKLAFEADEMQRRAFEQTPEYEDSLLDVLSVVDSMVKTPFRIEDEPSFPSTSTF